MSLSLAHRMLPALWAPVQRAQPTPAPGGPWDGTWAADTPQPPQQLDWTCSACALDWVLRATAIAPSHTRPLAVAQIGYPQNINPAIGLADASGGALRAVYASYGVKSEQGWLDFDTVYELAQRTTGQMSGAAWYHWVGIRGVTGDAIAVANSAPGYMGVDQMLDRADFARLGGFSVVWLER